MYVYARACTGHVCVLVHAYCRVREEQHLISIRMQEMNCSLSYFSFSSLVLTPGRSTTLFCPLLKRVIVRVTCTNVTDADSILSQEFWFSHVHGQSRLLLL